MHLVTRRLDLETEGVRVLGAHEACVSCTVYSHHTSIALTNCENVWFWTDSRLFLPFLQIKSSLVHGIVQSNFGILEKETRIR